MGKADDSATFALELEDKTSGAAANAAGALKALRDTMEDDLASLKAMSQAMRNMKGSSEVAIETFKKLKDQITAKKSAIAGAQEQYIKLGGNLRDLAKSGKAGGEGLGGLVEAAKGGGGPIASMIEGVSGLKSKLGAAGLAGAAAVAVVALVALTAALGAYGIAQANAARAERLSLEALTKIPNWYGQAAGKASEMEEAINAVSSSSALGRDKISGYTTELYRMGLRGQNLTDALEATAIASSAAGESYGSMVKGMLAGAAMTGQSVKKLADNVKARFGGIAKAQTLDLNVQVSKLKENFGQLFTGLKIEAFLSALHAVTDLFSQNTYSGKALKSIMGDLFNPLIGGLEKVGPIAKNFFQGMVIAALYFEIIVLTLRNKIRDAFGNRSMFKGLDWMKIGLWAGIIVGAAFAVVMGAIVGTLWLLGAACVAVGEQIYFVLIQPLLAGYQWLASLDWGAIGTSIAAPFKAAMAWFSGLDWGQIGTDIVNGIVDGIKKGYQLVITAVKGIGTAALKSLRGELDSHSPSKKFYELGFTAPQGVVMAMKAGRPLVERSVEDMMSMPGGSGDGGGVQPIIPLGNDNGPAAAPASATVAASPGASPASAPSVTIEQLHYHSSGKENHKADAQDFKQQLEATLEGAAIRLGAA